MIETKPWPVEVRVKTTEKLLEIDFEDGKTFSLPAEFLRVESPSAEVQGHGVNQKTLISGRKHIGFLGTEPVGHYAIRIRFDDMHDSGIYSWDYLRYLGEKQSEIWQNYLKALVRAGLSRDP